MNIPMHGINLDFTHSSEAKLLHSLVKERGSSSGREQDEFMANFEMQLVEAIELMESVEA
ncbi:hypothetical protein ACPV54_25555 [Vibrio mediterranei]